MDKTQLEDMTIRNALDSPEVPNSIKRFLRNALTHQSRRGKRNKEIIEDRKHGIKIKDLAKKYDLSPSGISKILHEESSFKDRGAIWGDKIRMSADVLQMREDGLTLKEIAEKMDLTESHVYAICSGKISNNHALKMCLKKETE